jgi:acetyltransferase-like isoleucine patch superfamily enzyme
LAYHSHDALEMLGFRHLGRGAKVSDKAAIYDAHLIKLGDHCRIDDFCVVSGRISIGAYCHVTPQCLLAGGQPGIVLEDFVTLAYGVKVFAQSDDYSGRTLVNSLIPKKFKREVFASVRLGRHTIVGAGACILPGANIEEGCAIGAMSLVLRPTQAWGIYAGVPARRVRDRSRDLLALERQFMEERDDSV